MICGRPTDERYCRLHAGAYQNLIQGFEVWTRALDVDWREYLQRVAANQRTGRWVVDVCQDLLAQGGKPLKD